MQIPSLFNQRTIRHRLILLNAITIVLIFALVTIYTCQLISLENKLVTMEQVDDLFNNILEVRRHEKNIMLQLDEDNATKAGQSLQKINSHFEKLSPKFNELSEKELFLHLKENFSKYKVILPVAVALKQTCCIMPVLHKQSNHVITLFLKNPGRNA